MRVGLWMGIELGGGGEEMTLLIHSVEQGSEQSYRPDRAK